MGGIAEQMIRSLQTMSENGDVAPRLCGLLPVGGGFARRGGVADWEGESAGVVGSLEQLDMGDVGIGSGLLGDRLHGIPVFFEVWGVERADDQAEF